MLLVLQQYIKNQEGEDVRDPGWLKGCRILPICGHDFGPVNSQEWLKVTFGRLLNELFRMLWWLFPLFMVLCVSLKPLHKAWLEPPRYLSLYKMTDLGMESFCRAEPSRQKWSMSWEQHSYSHLFCTSGFEGIRINPLSPELICHNWNHRAILALEKGEKYRRKTRLYALPVLSSGLSNMNILGLCCWWAILSPIEIFCLFLCFGVFKNTFLLLLLVASNCRSCTEEQGGKISVYLEKSCSNSLEVGWQSERTPCWNENPFSLGMWWFFLFYFFILMLHWTKTAVIHLTPCPGFCQ